MVEVGNLLYFAHRDQWRRWLQENHASETEAWLVYHRNGSGRPSIAYNDAVDEALCFGWIDSIVKKVGPESRAQRFTPRRPGSKLSEMNKVRVRRLAQQGLMTEAGLAAAGDSLEEPFQVPADILVALMADAETWENFLRFPESYKRIRVGWIDGSRQRQDVFETRLRYFLRMTKRNKRFGMVQ